MSLMHRIMKAMKQRRGRKYREKMIKRELQLLKMLMILSQYLINDMKHPVSGRTNSGSSGSDLMSV